MSKIKIYKGNPTLGGTDGTLVSSSTHEQPIETALIRVPDTGYETGDWIKLALRCDEGFETQEDVARHVSLTLENGTPSVECWRFAPDSAGSAGTPEAWGAGHDITSKVDDTNFIFWIQARVHDHEEPLNDITVIVKALALIGGQ